MPTTTVDDPIQASRKRCFSKIALRDGVCYLSGALNVETVPALYQQTGDLLRKVTALTLDLGGVTQSDSSGVALLLVWIRFFRQQAKSISVTNIPTQMLAMIQLARLTSVIPIK